MKILINGNADIVTVEDGSTLGTILKQLRDFLRSHQLVILAMELDGKPFPAEEEVRLAEQPTTQFDTLQVDAQDLKTMCSEMLATMELATTELSVLTRQTAAQLQEGNTQGIDEKLQQMFQRFGDVKTGLIMVCNLAGISFDELMVDGDPFAQKAAEMTLILQEIETNMNNADAFALAETLEFELAERLTEWRRAAEVLRENLLPPEPLPNE